MGKLRICQIVNNLDVGGLEKLVIDLLRNLDGERFEPHLICLHGPGKLFEQTGLPAERCLVLHPGQALNLGVARVDPLALWRIRSFVRARRIDLVHTHNAAPLIYGGIGIRLGWPRPRLVYSEHNQIYSASAAGKAKFRYYVRLADQVVAVSHDLEATLAREVGVTRPIEVIHNGIDGERFRQVDGQEIRAELGCSGGEVLVGTGVVLSEQKGIRYLLRAAEQVVAAEPRARFVIAGDGPLRAELEQQAAAAGLAERVTFLGYRGDMPAVISALDLYVLPSLWEGLPLALLEAMAIGKPIVTTTVGGNPEVVEHGVNGWLVPSKDSDALAAAIVDAVRDEAGREAASEANTRKFATQFSLPAMVGAHERLYDSIAR